MVRCLWPTLLLGAPAELSAVFPIFSSVSRTLDHSRYSINYLLNKVLHQEEPKLRLRMAKCTALPKTCPGIEGHKGYSWTQAPPCFSKSLFSLGLGFSCLTWRLSQHLSSVSIFPQKFKVFVISPQTPKDISLKVLDFSMSK